MSALDTFDADRMRCRLQAYLRQQVGDDVEIGTLKRYTVGFSWVTFGFTATWSEDGRRITHDLILRIGPPSGIFAPYRAAPEFVTLRSLADSRVPVPRVYWYSDNSTALGAPFFVSAFVKGDAPVPWTADGGPAFDEAARLNLGDQFIAALAALHTFSWRDTPVAGIDGATDPEETASSQIAFWERLMRQWSARRYPILEWALIWFRAHAPRAPRIGVVHGDYRIGNFLERGASLIQRRAHRGREVSSNPATGQKSIQRREIAVRRTHHIDSRSAMNMDIDETGRDVAPRMIDDREVARRFVYPADLGDQAIAAYYGAVSQDAVRQNEVADNHFILGHCPITRYFSKRRFRPRVSRTFPF